MNSLIFIRFAETPTQRKRILEVLCSLQNHIKHFVNVCLPAENTTLQMFSTKSEKIGKKPNHSNYITKTSKKARQVWYTSAT